MRTIENLKMITTVPCVKPYLIDVADLRSLAIERAREEKRLALLAAIGKGDGKSTHHAERYDLLMELFNLTEDDLKEAEE